MDADMTDMQVVLILRMLLYIVEGCKDKAEIAAKITGLIDEVSMKDA